MWLLPEGFCYSYGLGLISVVFAFNIELELINSSASTQCTMVAGDFNEAQQVRPLTDYLNNLLYKTNNMMQKV